MKLILNSQKFLKLLKGIYFSEGHYDEYCSVFTFKGSLNAISILLYTLPSPTCKPHSNCLVSGEFKGFYFVRVFIFIFSLFHERDCTCHPSVYNIELLYSLTSVKSNRFTSLEWNCLYSKYRQTKTWMKLFILSIGKQKRYFYSFHVEQQYDFCVSTGVCSDTIKRWPAQLLCLVL